MRTQEGVIAHAALFREAHTLREEARVYRHVCERADGRVHRLRAYMQWRESPVCICMHMV